MSEAENSLSVFTGRSDLSDVFSPLGSLQNFAVLGQRSSSRLCSEMNAAFCCASLGIVPTVRQCRLHRLVLEGLREDNRAIARAAFQASKAADYLLLFLLGEGEISNDRSVIPPTAIARPRDRPSVLTWANLRRRLGHRPPRTNSARRSGRM